jgi:hypothetical protein
MLARKPLAQCTHPPCWDLTEPFEQLGKGNVDRLTDVTVAPLIVATDVEDDIGAEGDRGCGAREIHARVRSRRGCAHL